MSLSKVIYPLLVDGGINTKADDKLLGPGDNHILVENVDYSEIGAINKRNGFDLLTDVTSGGGTLSSKFPRALIEHNDELISIGKTCSSNIYSYNPQDDKWNKKNGELISPFVFIEDKFSDEINSFNNSMIEIPIINTRVVAYITYNENVFSPSYALKVYSQNHATKEKKLLLFTTSTIPIDSVQVQAFNQVSTPIFILYSKSAPVIQTLYCLKMDLDGSNQVPVTLGTYNNAAGTLSFDSCITGSYLFVVQDNLDVNGVGCYKIDILGAIVGVYSNPGIIKAKKVGIQACYSCTTFGTKVFICYGNSDLANSLTIFGVETVPAIAVISPELQFAPGDGVEYVERVSISMVDSNLNVMCLYQFTSSYFNGNVRSAIFQISTNSIITYSANNIHGMNLVGNLFSIDSSSDRVFIAQSSVIHQEKYLICNIDYATLTIKISGHFAINGLASAVTRLMFGLTVIVKSTRNKIVLSSAYQGKDNHYYFPSSYIVREIKLAKDIDVDNSNYVSSIFVNRIEFSSEYEGINSSMGGTTLIAGSIVREYDGFSFLEQSFIDGNFLLVSETANAGMPLGTYSYAGIYEHVDSNGNIHRSRPFAARTITTIGNNSVSIAFLTTSSFGMSISTGSKKYRVVIYRTTKNGVIFYRLGAGNKSVNLYGVSTSPYEDKELDTDLISSEQLYNTNGILDNTPLPPVKFLMAANNRIFSISSEDENLIYFSQLYIYGESINFTVPNNIRVDCGLLSRSGKAIALGSLDGKIIVFKDQSICYFAGYGPNQAGEQSDYTDPKLISSDIGIADVKSIVSIPDGIMFKSNKGIYLLDRSMQLTYVGFQVEDYNSEKVIGTSNIIDRHIVLFMTANRTMAFDYFQKKWSLWTISGRSVTTYKKLPVFCNLSDRIMYQNTSSYLDGAVRYSMKIITPWIKLSGIQNYQRIYKLMVLGTFFSSHTLNIKSYYDYNDSDFSSYTVSPLVGDEIYQYDVSIIKQKGQAMKFEISDSSASGTNKSFKLSNLSMILGQKKGTNKTPDSRKY